MNLNFKSKKTWAVLFSSAICAFLIFNFIEIAYSIFAEKYPKLHSVMENEYADMADSQEIINYEGRFVINREEKIRVGIPDGWTGMWDYSAIGLLDPALKDKKPGEEMISEMKKGACFLALEVLKTKKVREDLTTYAEDIQEMIGALKSGEGFRQTDKVKEEVITIDGQEGLKTTSLGIKKEARTYYWIRLEIPVGQKLFILKSILTSEECLKKFDDIFKTVSFED